MKQKLKRNKTNSSSAVTRAVLRQELKNFATKNDLKNFATKNEFFDFKIDIFAEINRAELKAIDREKNYHSDVMTQFDKIMKKLETMRQENEIDNFRRDEKIENHENRIKILESA